MQSFVFFAWGIFLTYALFNAALAVTWLRLPRFCPSVDFSNHPFLSVIIVVRNEAENIGLLLQDLNQQTYPAECFEVLIADDGSTDDTVAQIQAFTTEARYALRVFPLQTDATTRSPKKKGITEAIALARGELMITTDGDCRVSKGWLACLADAYQSRGAQLLSGAVTFERDTGLLEQMQTVEFASLMGSGACAMQWGFPTMCNGANLAYPKAVFEAVGGFAGVDHLASGDDELLMHKIARRYPGRLFFLKHPAAIVRTRAQPTLAKLYQQRKRWASKWDAYQDHKISLLAIFVFLSNFTLLLTGALTATDFYPLSAFILQAFVKCGAEILPLALFLAYLQPPRRALARIALIPLVQVAYPFYVVFFGLAAQRKGFEWKGRRMR